MKSIAAVGVTIARDSPSAGWSCMANLARARFNSYTVGGTAGFCAGSCVKNVKPGDDNQDEWREAAQTRRVFTR